MSLSSTVVNGYNSMTANVNNKSIPVKFFKTSISSISVVGAPNSPRGENLNTKRIGDMGIYGTNCSFFHTDTSRYGNAYSVAINNHASVHNYGGANEIASWKTYPDVDSILFCTDAPVNGSSVFLANTTQFPWRPDYSHNFVLSEIKWAIGGHSLRLSGSYSGQSSFINSLPQGTADYSPASSTQRTFIGVNGGYAYVCVVINSTGCNMYDEHLILKDLGCNLGVNVDGGGSTQIRAKTELVYSAGEPAGRPVPTFIRVNY